MVYVMNFLQSQVKEALDKNTVYHILARDPRIRSCRGVPMEEKRLEVTPEEIAEYFRRASEALDGVPAHFVFNMDEMGHQEWADKQTRTCFVPSEHVADEVPYPVSRTSGLRIHVGGSPREHCAKFPKCRHHIGRGQQGVLQSRATPGAVLTATNYWGKNGSRGSDWGGPGTC
jgi:hypothetical protein